MISSCDGFLFLCILYRHVISLLTVSGEETLGVVERFPVFFAFGHIILFAAQRVKNVCSISSFSWVLF